MAENNTTIRDTGALGVLAEQIRTKGDPDAELHHLLIARLACSKAQIRGCVAGPESTDWIQAEAEIRAIHRRPPHPHGEKGGTMPDAGLTVTDNHGSRRRPR